MRKHDASNIPNDELLVWPARMDICRSSSTQMPSGNTTSRKVLHPDTDKDPLSLSDAWDHERLESEWSSMDDGVI
jgi:hypothetical protein